MRDDKKYLFHIDQCIARIEEDVAGGHQAFQSSHLVQDAVLRNLQVIAESTKRLSEPLKTSCTEIDWSGIAGFRNFLVHEYLGVDLEAVWQIVATDLPALKAAVVRLLNMLPN
ncbi:MAG: DUF86 domain-containing protein [Acidobacteriota bacterium]